MQVRKFQANTIHEATNMVRKALGAEALILSTRRLTNKSEGGGGVGFEVWAVPNETYGDQDHKTDKSDNYLEGVKSDLLRIQDMLF